MTLRDGGLEPHHAVRAFRGAIESGEFQHAGGCSAGSRRAGVLLRRVAEVLLATAESQAALQQKHHVGGFAVDAGCHRHT